MRSTSSPSPKSVTTHPVAPTTYANKPRERAAKKPSAHSSEESPTPSGDNYKSTLAPRVESGPGTTPRGDSYIQRGRLNPEHRHFGSVSSRTQPNDNPARTRRRQRHHPTRTRTLKPCLLTQRGFERGVEGVARRQTVRVATAEARRPVASNGDENPRSRRDWLTIVAAIVSLLAIAALVWDKQTTHIRWAQVILAGAPNRSSTRLDVTVDVCSPSLSLPAPRVVETRSEVRISIDLRVTTAPGD